MEPHDVRFRVIVVGDIDVGKTSFATRYISGTFEKNPPSTLEVDCLVKTFEIHHKTVRLEVWDTAGQERFRSISSSAYRMNDGVFLAFDITSSSSFERLPLWLGEIGRYAPINVVRLLIGTKCDLANHRTVSRDEIDDFCRINGLEYVETSAKESIGVELAFEKVIENMIKKHNLEKEDAIGSGFSVRPSSSMRPSSSQSLSPSDPTPGSATGESGCPC